MSFRSIEQKYPQRQLVPTNSRALAKVCKSLGKLYQALREPGMIQVRRRDAEIAESRQMMEMARALMQRQQKQPVPPRKQLSLRKPKTQFSNRVDQYYSMLGRF